MTRRSPVSRLSLAATAVLACLLAAALRAATAPPRSLLDELDDVVITARDAPPLTAFVEYPEFDAVAISPAGTRLAMSWTSGRRQLTVTEFPSMLRVDSQLQPPHMGANDLRWATDRWLLVQPDYPQRGFRGGRDLVGSLFVIDVERHGMRAVNAEPLQQAASFEATLAGDPLSEQRRKDAASARKESGESGAPAGNGKPARKSRGPVRLVQARTQQPDQLLFQTTRSNTRGDSDGHGAFVLDLADLGQSRLATLPLHDGQFVTGPGGSIALVTGRSRKDEQVIYYLPPPSRAAGMDWQLLYRGAGGERGLRPVAWTGNGEEYYALEGRGPTRAVVAWNAATGTQRLLYRNPDVDIDDFALDPAGKPWVFSGIAHIPVHWYPDPAHPLAQLHQSMTKRLPGHLIDITSASDDLAIAVAKVSSGSRPTMYLVMDVKSGASLTGMWAHPALRSVRLPQVTPIQFLARDGMLIRGHLTIPVDADGKLRRQLPMVVIAHDGPGGEPSTSSYEFERQLFASRGYAVMQVNHRGSRGRGEAFERAGDGKWGAEVQDDYADAVRWAIRDGVAASDRICFYGTRFGGYSALMTAAREPDLLRCVISVAGIHDLPAMLKKDAADADPALLQALGNDMKELKARSPVTHAAAIKAKVLLVQQDHDEDVSLQQFMRMRKALLDAGGKPAVSSIASAREGFVLMAERRQVYERLLQFLGENIGN